MLDRKLIYNMPAEEYHSLQRFSASGIKKLLVSAQDFWSSSWMNPDRYETKSDVFNLGTAYHTRILEGREVFDRRYAVKPECDRRTNIGKAIYEKFQSEHPNAECIDQRVYDEINKAEAIKLFQDGKPEVTVIWDDEETGVPMKSRLDYLKPRKIDDLKTFSNSSGMDLNRLLAKHIVQYGYHVQQAVYTTAVPEHEFTFIFQQVGQANNCIAKPFPSTLLLADKGRNLMRFGINKFADMYRTFGTKPWFDTFEVAPFTDESFPLYALED